MKIATLADWFGVGAIEGIRESEHCYNLEGRVEMGGELRVLKITPYGDEEFSIKNTVVREDKLLRRIKSVIVGESGYGDVWKLVSNLCGDCVEELAKQGIKADKRKILDTAPVQSLGVTQVRIELYKNVIGTINVRLIGSDS